MQFIESVKNDKILMAFIVIIVARGIWACLANIQIYCKISGLYKKIKGNEIADLPVKLKEKLETYKGNNEYGVVNTQTLVEEYISEGNESGPVLNLKIKTNKGAISQMIILGVLGTFWGLVVGLSQINFQELTAVAEKIDISSIVGLLNGIHTAFYTSIVGIIGSLVLQFFLNTWNSENLLMKYMLKLEMNLNTYIEKKRSKETFEKLTEMNLNIMTISKELHALTELENAAKELRGFNEDFRGNIMLLTGTLGQSAEMMSQFSVNVIQLSNKFEGLIDEFDNHNKSNKQIINCISGTYESIKESLSVQKEVKIMTKQMFEDENDVMQAIQYKMREVFEKIDSQQDQIINRIQKVCEYSEIGLRGQQEQMAKLNKEISACLEESVNAIYSKQEKGLDKMDEVFMRVSEDYQETLEEFKGNINQLREGFEHSIIHETQQYNQIANHFNESNHVLRQLTDTYSKMDNQQEQLILQVEKLVGELRGHTDRIDNNIGRRLKESLEVMKKTMDMINGKLQSMTEDRLKEEFIKAYSNIESDRKGA